MDETDTDDYGIVEALPNLDKTDIEKIKGRLKELGVEENEDLRLLGVPDLTRGKLLSKIASIKLIQHWQKLSGL